MQILILDYNETGYTVSVSFEQTGPIYVSMDLNLSDLEQLEEVVRAAKAKIKEIIQKNKDLGA